MEHVTPAPARGERRRGIHRRLYDWVLKWSAHPRATWALFLVAVAESSVFIVPPDVLLIAMTVARPKRARRYAGICTFGSVSGGVLGYAIGWGVWSAVSEWFFRVLGPFGFTEVNFLKVQSAYQAHAFWAIFTAGFTPIPYKVFTIAAGVFHITIPVFLAASLVGRAARFFLVAELVSRLGPAVQPFIERHLGWLSIVFVVLLILGFYILKLL